MAKIDWIIAVVFIMATCIAVAGVVWYAFRPDTNGFKPLDGATYHLGDLITSGNRSNFYFHGFTDLATNAQANKGVYFEMLIGQETSGGTQANISIRVTVDSTFTLADRNFRVLDFGTDFLTLGAAP